MTYTQNEPSSTPDPYQRLGPGERFATPEDWADVERDYPMAQATAEGVGLTYSVHAHMPEQAGPDLLRYMVTYRPAGPAGLQDVVVATDLTWPEAMDTVRDRVSAELRAEAPGTVPEPKPTPGPLAAYARDMDALADGQDDATGAMVTEWAGATRAADTVLRSFVRAYRDEIAAFYDEKVAAHPWLTECYVAAAKLVGEWD
jgi:hypothetical protein